MQGIKNDTMAIGIRLQLLPFAELFGIMSARIQTRWSTMMRVFGAHNKASQYEIRRRQK